MIFLSCLTGFSQHRIIQFQTLSFEDGMSDNRISKTIQDQKGYMWFGTRLGIERYNGSTFKTYQLPKDHIEINDIAQDLNGTIWVATRIGLFFHHEETDTFQPWVSSDPIIAESLAHPITALLDDKMGHILCTTEKGDLIEISHALGVGKIRYRIPPLKDSNTIDYGSALYKDMEGIIWIGTRSGRLIGLKGSELEEMELKENFGFITAIARDQKDRIWIGTANNGVFTHNLRTSINVHYTTPLNEETSSSINSNLILDLVVDHKDNIWIGTDGGGLNLFIQAENKFTSFRHNRFNNYPLADNSILNIFMGTDDIIWLGTVHGGVSYFKNNISLTHIPPHKIGFEQMDKQSSKILEVDNGDIWFTAGRNGIRRYRPRTGEVSIFLDDPTNTRDLSGNNILTLYEDQLNRLWMGTFRGGLNVFDQKTQTFLILDNPIKNTAIFTITGDAIGNIWVGTDTGIYVYSPDLRLKKRYSTQQVPQLKSNMITALYNDIKGDMWVGTISGLYVFKKDTVVAFNSVEGDLSTLSGDRILAIMEDDDLSVLVGTYGYGLNRFIRSENSFRQIGKEDGLAGNIISGISIDPNKNIWCSTNYGLSKISADGGIPNYNILHGIPSFQGGSAIISKNGYLIMGSSLGLSFIDANNLQENLSITTKVFFTKGTILNNKGVREIEIGFKNNDQITLDPKDNLVSLYFSNSNYWNHKASNYSYNLEGLNKEWQDIGHQEVLTFSNLKPGEYKLRISTGNKQNKKDANLATMKIVVRPSFFQNEWTKIVLSLIGATLLFSFFKWRLNIIKTQRERLQILVNKKSEEIKKEQEKVYQGEIALLKAEKVNQVWSRKKLKEELDFKTGELTNYTLRTVHKNHLLSEIKEHLLTEVQEKAPSKENLRKIIGLIDDSFLLDEDWETFYNLFNQIHTTFMANLKTYGPKLTDREIRLSALIKLNFSSQHIATLFGISLSSVKVARHRLRKKLGIQDSETFEGFFERLEALELS